MKKLILSLFVACLALTASAEDGHQLWLRYQPVNKAQVTTDKLSPTIQIAKQELETYYNGASVTLKLDAKMPNDDGYRIDGTTITARRDVGLLYGAYALLRKQQTSDLNYQPSAVDESHPAYSLRLLNHWDNPNGTVERGFAGRSIFLNPDPERMKIYARANASIGINGTVLNNVNAKPEALTTESLQKAKEIADQLRPYGIKVYLSINFASPIKEGGLTTADPLNSDVIRWWKNKVNEIYKMIPDFGGFLVKANSEGEPGPQDFGRTHADGANMLGKVLKPHKGIVMWRAFVYAPRVPIVPTRPFWSLCRWTASLPIT